MLQQGVVPRARAPSEPRALGTDEGLGSGAASGVMSVQSATPPLSVMHASALVSASQAMSDTTSGRVRKATTSLCAMFQRTSRRSCPAVTTRRPARHTPNPVILGQPT